MKYTITEWAKTVFGLEAMCACGHPIRRHDSSGVCHKCECSAFRPGASLELCSEEEPSSEHEG